jgi:hypothetical protein
MMEGSGSRSVQIPNTDGSGSGRSQNIWIRIYNTGSKLWIRIISESGSVFSLKRWTLTIVSHSSYTVQVVKRIFAHLSWKYLPGEAAAFEPGETVSDSV